MFQELREIFLAHHHSREVWDPENASLGRDRRLFQRVPVQIPCRIDNPYLGAEGQGTAINLSLGGVGMMTLVSWPEGSQVRVLLDSVSLILSGIIVFRMEVPGGSELRYRYGVKFQKMGFRDVVHLRRVLRKQYNGPLAVL
ncbi:MAG: PilZ domain-containing protein [Elusimicrobiota bacterium]|jgi:hypothetical protein